MKPDIDPIQTALEKAIDRLSGKNLSVALSSLLITHTSALAHQQQPGIAQVYARLDQVLREHGTNVEDHFLSILFIDLISEVEIYLAALVRAVIAKNPHKVGNIQFKLSDVLESPTHEELITRASDAYLNGVMFKKPAEYLSDISQILSIDPSVISDQWPNYIEAKARRDLGVHNNWICNETYLRKIKEAGLTSIYKIGDTVRPDTDYLRQLASLIDTISLRLANAVHVKHIGG